MLCIFVNLILYIVILKINIFLFLFLFLSVPTDKIPLLIYMQGRKGLIQTMGPCKHGYLHHMQAKSLTGIQGAHKNKRPCRQWVPTEIGPYRQEALTYKGSLHTRGPYRQGALTDKELIQTRASTANDPYRRCVILTDNGLLPTRCPYRQEAFTYNWPLQTRGPYRQGVLTDKELIETIGIYSKWPLTLYDSYRQGALTDKMGPL